MKKLIKDLKKYRYRNEFMYNDVTFLKWEIKYDTYMRIFHPISYIRGFLYIKNNIWPTGAA
jgi:hypothetical protein